LPLPPLGFMRFALGLQFRQSSGLLYRLRGERILTLLKACGEFSKSVAFFLDVLFFNLALGVCFLGQVAVTFGLWRLNWGCAGRQHFQLDGAKAELVAG